MKKTSILLLLLSLSMQFILAQQPTQAELDKMMKQAQEQMKKYGNDSTVNSVMKGLQDQKKQISDAMKNKTKEKKTPVPIEKKDTDTSFSSINNKLLNSLPLRTFTRAELISYLHNLDLKLSAFMHSSYGTDIGNIPIAAVERSGTSIGLWMKGKVNESVLVTLKGAELLPDNNLLLNNAGGILTSCGLGVYGIPVLQYVLEKQPGNNMILNNLGQAYLDLGDDKKAEQYFLKCVSSYKYYPDANLALAYIYNSRGNKSAAINYVENSLRGAWSSKADNLLSILKPDAKMMDYVRHRYKQPEFFNFDKYPMLPQCKNIDDISGLEPQYVAYKMMIDQLAEKYSQKYRDARQASDKSVPEKIAAAAKVNRSPHRPFGAFGIVVLAALKKEYKDRYQFLDSFLQHYSRERNALNDKYEEEYQKILHKYEQMEYGGDQEAKCREINTLSNDYLPQYAEETELLQEKMLSYYKNYFNDLAYWTYIASINDDAFRTDFNLMVIEFLAMLNQINTTRVMESKYSTHRFYPCRFTASGKVDAKDIEITEPDCYLTPKIEVELGAFRLEVSCETYKLEAGEGLIGKVEYSRSSGDVTVAFGVGAAVPRVLFHSPGIEAGLEGEAKSQLYITFDKTGNPTDLGVLWETELKAVIGMGSVKESIGLKEGVTAGFGSGVQIEENSQLKQAIDKTYPVQPDDKQENKNVPLYKK